MARPVCAISWTAFASFYAEEERLQRMTRQRRARWTVPEPENDLRDLVLCANGEQPRNCGSSSGWVMSVLASP